MHADRKTLRWVPRVYRSGQPFYWSMVSALLGIIDGLFSLLTLGFFGMDTQLDFVFWCTMRQARRRVAEEEEEED